MRTKHLICMSLTAALLSLTGAENGPYQLAGRTWLPWEQAQQLALQEGKPILVVQMLGDLNEQWC
jgi:hypothetical protein